MSIDPIILSIPLFFALIGIELVFERIERRRLYRLNDATANISCGITDQILGVFTKVITVTAYTFAYQFRVWEGAEGWLWAIFAFIAVDLAYYWSHRVSHEVNLFWAGHVVHHQSEDYNLSVALRQGAFQKLFTLWFYLPLALLGVSPELFVLCFGINLLYQFWIHTELVGKMPAPVEAVMNTPSHHRVHHGRNPKYIDRNHAGVFIVWDRLFGTFQEEEEHPTYGITTPLASWNPFYAHLQHFDQIASDWNRMPRWRDRVNLLWRKPGWQPESLGGYRAPLPVDETNRQKYDPQLGDGWNSYLLVQYLMVLAATAGFLFQADMFALDQKLVGVVFILGSISVLGGLFDGRPWARTAEAVRWFGIPFLVGWLLPGPPLAFAVGVAVAFGSVSLLWLAVAPEPQHEGTAEE